MKQKAQPQRPTSITADPEQWSAQSKQSVAYQCNFVHEYVDRPYACRRCGMACVFTAKDQKYTFEVKKASIDQGRKFCSACWSASHALRSKLAERDAQWAEAKHTLRGDREFLAHWLELLKQWGEFEPYKQDVAKINMLRGLLGTDGLLLR
jgi:hypothetical protein